MPINCCRTPARTHRAYARRLHTDVMRLHEPIELTCDAYKPTRCDVLQVLDRARARLEVVCTLGGNCCIRALLGGLLDAQKRENKPTSCPLVAPECKTNCTSCSFMYLGSSQGTTETNFREDVPMTSSLSKTSVTYFLEGRLFGKNYGQDLYFMSRGSC